MRPADFFLCGALAAGVAAAQADAGAFVDATADSGLDFVHFNGMVGEFYFPEMTGQGGALFDYDNDGDLDLYLVQGALLGSGEKPPLFPPRHDGLMDRLYRNDLAPGPDGKQHPRFVDVTAGMGAEVRDYGMGAASGDYDNDGRVDLYVTAYGSNRLLRNLGGGAFEDVTEASGTADSAWSTSAAFLDFDRDGWLDLYVANYVDFSVARNPRCYARSSRQDYCGPSAFTPQRDRLFRNRGDGTFEDATARLLQAYEPGPGLGVVAADFNGDGWTDIYVANDGGANHLWINDRGQGFRDDALFAGAAVNRHGLAEASMGVDAGDFDGDGDQDLFMTHLMGETNTLYVNDGTGLFEDRTDQFGLGTESFPYTAFGTGWFDYDNDGWLDLLVLNGAVQVIEEQARAGEPYPLRQPNQLFRNLEGRGFRRVEGDGDSVFAVSEVSRGAAFGDVDNDGDTDLVVFNNNGPVRLLLNQVGNLRPWVGLRVLTSGGGRDALGAQVGLERTGRQVLWRRARTDGSYCAASDPRILIGLGDAPTLSGLRVRWPDGSEERRPAPSVGAYAILRQGGAGSEGKP